MIQFMLSPGRIVEETSASLRLTEQHLARHVMVAGGTGGGKSVLTRNVCRQLAAQGRGFTLIDPHGTTARGVAQDLAVRGVDPARVHWIHPTAESSFCMDIFAGAPLGGSLAAYDDWLVATVDRAFGCIERNLSTADQEMQKRKKRVHSNLGFCCGMGAPHNHAGYDKMLVMSNPDHPEFDAILERVRPLAMRTEYGRNVMLDMDQLAAMRGPKLAQAREKLTESCINTLRTVLKPNLQRTLRPRPHSLLQRDVILNRHFQLLNLKAPNFSREQANVLGGLVINSLIREAEAIADERAEEDRVPHYMIVEEAENFIGQDLSDGLGELRKCKLSIVLIFQNLGCLRRGNLDLVAKVVSQCGLQITFQQGDVEDIEYFAKAFGYGSLDFTPFRDKRIVPAGYDYVLLPTVSEGQGTTVTDSTTATISKARARATGVTEAEGINASVSRALSLTHADGEAHGVSETRSDAYAFGRSSSQGGSETETETESSAKGKTHTDAVNDSHGRSGSAGESFKAGAYRELPAFADYGALDKTQTRSEAWNDAHGSSSADGTSETETKARARGETTQHNEGETRTWTKTKGEGKSHVKNSTDGIGFTLGAMDGASKSKAKTASESEAEARADGTARAVGATKNVTRGLAVAPLAKHVVEEFDSGLKMSVQDQLAQVMKILASLPDRVVLVKCKGMDRPFMLRVHDFVDPYEEASRAGRIVHVPRSREWREHELNAYLDRVFAAHSYNFVPDQTPFDEPIIVDARAGDEDTVLA